jgi:hypothetical protein
MRNRDALRDALRDPISHTDCAEYSYIYGNIRKDANPHAN